MADRLVIVHEDADCIVVDKPSGLLTAGMPGETRLTLFDLVKRHCRSRGTTKSRQRQRDEQAASSDSGTGGRNRAVAGVIHRLDKEASGLVVFSRGDRAFHWLKDDFKAKRVHRIYLAVVEGILGEPGQSGTMQSFLKEDRSGRVFSISADEFRGAGASASGGAGGEEHDQARPALTHYKVLNTGGGRTLVQLRLETGRKHQIRVHLSEKGFPIVGDERYGARSNSIGRLALHATELGFTHPATGQKERFHSPAPPSFYGLVGADVPNVPQLRAAPAGPPVHSAVRRAPAAGTSWDEVAGWYDELLGEKRNDHYQNVIVPGTLRLLSPTPDMRVLDIACGQGVLCREIAGLGASVTGIDASPGLIDAAKARGARGVKYLVADARELEGLRLAPASFDAAVCVMALGNIDPLDPVFRGLASLLRPGGTFVAVISHPAFRAHGQSSWGWDDKEGRQFRRIDGYLSVGQKAIQMHPGDAPDVVTWSFHRPLQTYVRLLADAGMVVESLEEWPALRTSQPGPRAAEENRARREIPLFMAFRARRMPQPG